MAGPPRCQGDEGQRGHAERHHREDACRHVGGDQAPLHGKADADEGELAARRQQQPRLDAGAQRYAEQAAERHQQHRLDRHHGQEPAQHQQRLAPDEAEVDMHADREEEYAEQQAAEGIDHRLDGAAILGLRQQEAGDEGAERHRQVGVGRDHA